MYHIHIKVDTIILIDLNKNFKCNQIDYIYCNNVRLTQKHIFPPVNCMYNCIAIKETYKYNQ